MATMNPNVSERRHVPDRRSPHAGSTSKRMTAVDWIPMLLLMVGGLNWGLIGLFNFNLVSFLFGETSTLSRVVYVVVGLSALYSLYLSTKMSRGKL